MAMTWGEIAIAVTVISGWLFSRVTTREFALERVIDERVTSESVESVSRSRQTMFERAADSPPVG